MSALGTSISNAELAALCREFAVMLASDVKLMPAVITLRQQADNAYLRELLLEVQEDLENGLTMAAAFSHHPDVFSPFFIQLVRQGEFEGVLSEVFRKLAEHYESEGLSALGDAGQHVVVNLEVGAIVEVLRPLLVMVPVAVAFVGFVIAAIWWAMKAGVVSDQEAGPTILMTGALAFLLVAAAFSRFRPRRVSACSACGKLDTQVEQIVVSRGVAICNECIGRMVQQMRRTTRATTQPPAAAAPAKPNAARGRAPSEEGEGRHVVGSDATYLQRDPSQAVDLDEDL